MMMFTDCSSSTTSHLIPFNRLNGAFLSHRCVGLRTSVSCRGRRSLSIRSSSDASMVIDEIDVGKNIAAEIKTEVSRMKKSIGAVPGLAVILVGNRKGPQAYLNIPCDIVGIKTFIVRLAEDSSEEEVLKTVSRFNDDPCVHGIIFQSPLLSHIDEQNILNAVSIEKDVDGVHPINISRLAMRGKEPLFLPHSPKGCIELLHHYNFEIKGKRAVVIGRSNSVGVPAALLLQREDATVTIIHSKTKNPEEITRQADIIISAVGQPNLVRGSWIKPGAVVISVGISFIKDPNHPNGYRRVGDICYEEVCKVASAVTPIDGGTGAMTLTMLLSNTLTSAKKIHNFM